MKISMEILEQIVRNAGIMFMNRKNAGEISKRGRGRFCNRGRYAGSGICSGKSEVENFRKFN